MGVLAGVLSALGVEIGVGLTLLAGGIYLWKGAKVAKVVGGLLTSGMTYLVVTVVAVGGAIALGWLDPEPANVQAAGEVVWDLTGGYVIDGLAWVLERATEAISN